MMPDSDETPDPDAVLKALIRNCGKRPPHSLPCYEASGTGRYWFCRHGDVGDTQRETTCLARCKAELAKRMAETVQRIPGESDRG